MKTLILSSNNGGGHNAAAQALAECFSAHGEPCEIRDGLSFLSDGLSGIVSRSHTFLYRYAPEIFEAGYRRSEGDVAYFDKHPNPRRLIELGQYSLGRLIHSEGFECVICTHVFAALMLTAAIRQYDLSLKSAVVETDYSNTPGAADNEADFHFLPDKELALPLIEAGVPAETIVISGIPVRQAFYSKTDRRTAMRHFSIDPSRRHVIVMGGSMGAGPIDELTERLCAELDDGVEISVVCGSNDKLRSRLSKLGRFRNLRVVGFESNLSLLMDCADLLITKPGGISVTEAAVKGLPMLLIDVVTGWEQNNLNFFLANGGAVTGGSVEELCRRCGKLLSDEQTLAKMSASLRPFAEYRASEIIYSTLKGTQP